jgi:hypothetical protein
MHAGSGGVKGRLALTRSVVRTSTPYPRDEQQAERWTGAAVPGAIGTDTWTPIALPVRGAASSSNSQRTCSLPLRRRIGRFRNTIFPCYFNLSVVYWTVPEYVSYSRLSVVYCSYCTWTDASNGSDGLFMLFLFYIYITWPMPYVTLFFFFRLTEVLECDYIRHLRLCRIPCLENHPRERVFPDF